MGTSAWRCISNSVFSARTGADISRGHHRCRTSTSRSIGRRNGSIWGRYRRQCFRFSEGCEEGCSRVTIGSSVEFVRVVRFEGQKRLVATKLGSCWRRLARLRVAVTEKVPPPPATDAESEIAALRARLASVEEERDAAMEGRPAKRFRGETTRDRPGRLPEDFMPMCDEGIFQWMQDRQADLHDATLTGNATEASRLCHVMADAVTSFSKILTPPSLLANIVA